MRQERGARTRWRQRALCAAAFCLALSIAHAQRASAQAAEEQPLDISADNMAGSHGPEGDEVILKGHVHIQRGHTTLTADRGRYLRTQGMIYLDDHVRMVDSTTTVTCERASYSQNDDRLELSGNVVFEDRDATLHAPAATYERKLGRAELYGGVTGSDLDRTLTCDRAYYYRDSLLLKARGNVQATDVKNKLELAAEAIDYDRSTHEAVATGKPTLEAEDERGRHAVVRALTLRLNTESRIAEALDSVRVERDTLQASGDYGLFDEKANRGWLLGHPRAWDQETNVTGDTLELVTEGRRLKQVVVRNNAAVDYRGTGSKGEGSRLAGQRVDVFFTDDEIDSVVAVGKAKNEYRGVAQSGKTPEKSLAEGDTITVFFKKGDVERAQVQGAAKGEYHLATEIGDTLKAEQEWIKYDATRIRYEVTKNQMVLDGAAHLTYRDLVLTSRRVEYDLDRQTLVATGAPELVERGDKVTGHLMTYDLESRVGNIYRAETGFEKGLYHGRRIRRVNDNELDILGGSYSTCDREDPHYHFAAHWMKIYLKDKLVAKPVVFYLRKVPLLALPFWIFPLRPGRHSGFLLPQIEFGFSNAAGRFVRNGGYYWAPNDYMDLTLSGDYYQAQPTWVVRAIGNYKLLYALDGNFRGSFARNDNPQARSEDWDFDADHSQELSPRTRLVARGSFVSRRDYNSSNQYGNSLYQRLNRFLVSSVAISHAADWANISAVLERRQDLDADDAISDPDGFGPLHGPPPGAQASLPNITESLPSLSVSFPTRTIGALGLVKGTVLEKPLSTLYFDLDTRFVETSERRGFVSGYSAPFVSDSVFDATGNLFAVFDSTTLISQRVKRRWGTAANTSLTDSRRLFGWLNLQPSLRANGALFDFDQLGHHNVPTGTWSSALATGATFYGTFKPKIGALQGIRHVVSPVATFAYSPEFRSLIYRDAQGRRQERFQSFGGIGVSGFKQFLMNFGVNQRLQVKLKRGDQVQKLDNLVSLGTNGSYDFLYREHRAKHPLSMLGSNLSVQPPGVLSANLSWQTDVYSPRPVRSLNYNFGFNLSNNSSRKREAPELPVDATRNSGVDESVEGESWNLDVAYSYAGGYASVNRWSSNQTANLVFRCQLTRGWNVDYSASYDVTQREIGLQRFELIRELHCWQAVFTRTFAPGGEAEYYFKLSVKDQREIFLERGSRGASIGGIQ